MARMVEHELVRYEFADEAEEIASHTFSELNLMALRNELSTIAKERAVLSVDPDSPNAQLKFLLEAEYLRGKYEQVLFLLSLHIAAQDRMAKVVQAMVEQQKAEDANLKGD